MADGFGRWSSFSLWWTKGGMYFLLAARGEMMLQGSLHEALFTQNARGTHTNTHTNTHTHGTDRPELLIPDS